MEVRKQVITALLALPWLFPFSYGPSPAVMPWLFACACAALVWWRLAELNAVSVLQGWILAAGLSALIGIVQYAGATHPFAPWIAVTGPGEAFGNLRQRNQFATLTAIGLAALIWHAVVRPPPHGVRNWALVAVAVALAVANAASSSRTGMVQLLLLAAGVWLWGLWRERLVRHLVLAVLLAYAAASVALPSLIGSNPDETGIWARLRHEQVVCNSRLLLWRNVLELIAARPWTGWGWGELDYAHFMNMYSGPRFCELLDNAHDLPLHLAVELGLPVALVLCGSALVLVFRARPWQEPAHIRQAAWMILGLITLHSLLEYPLWYGPFQLAAVLCLWLLWRPVGGDDTSPQGRRNMARAVVTVAALGFIGYAAWDYWRVSQIYIPAEQRLPDYRVNTLDKIRDTRLFANQVNFAEYTLTPLSSSNAQRIHDMGVGLMHYSPEARVVEKLIEASMLIGRNDEAESYMLRYRAAYPAEYARWMARRTGDAPPDR